ncbi:winged helix-turn-helix transcriptional regulator [Methanofollis aquaemaris]|uniref:Winged helix-turn-helix transcriptional regulator n=1 Tax=Methanofollis aquaemaris TaxID=126734 RepID=A0A8A3S3W4_9EURY|nr:MarR family transcriptional regulator [Methanofollis aquaemaris]QSZ66967.1 winged helix-turn-helix transcriptional regulator [Methanofollis aquaemaris]
MSKTAGEDPVASLLRSKREITRFQILVEVAEHQPAVRQQEVAEKMGVTPQAVSEYIRELADDGFVSAYGRGRYEVTKEGIEWVLANAEVLENYARHVTRDVIQKVRVWPAVAAEPLHKGDAVGVFMKDGWLYASKTEQSAMGEVIADAEAGQDVGVARLTGLIDHAEGTVHVLKVPRIERGGSRKMDLAGVRGVLAGVQQVGIAGLEAAVVMKSVGRKPDISFGSREGVIEAAFHGVECAILIVDEEFTDFLKRLENAGLTYVIHDLILP